uniref:Uncharacterized protein n=1 Tax=Tanacetum cinerariifolium TaxID=118510 RepID=A0A699K5T5_TANCI|nr:hypothetical protein CTI12_AA123990 [Tanacetum cinerariifolium]
MNTAENQSLAYIIQHSVRIHSNIIIRQDGRVQSYSGLQLKGIEASIPSTFRILGHNRTNVYQKAIASTSNYLFYDYHRRRTGGANKCKSTNATKGDAFTSRGTEVSYHNIDAPSYQCVHCNVTKWDRIDHSINNGKGVYTFRINGQSYHRIGSLLPKEGIQPKYAQLWFFDMGNEVRNHMGAFIDMDNRDGVDAATVHTLIQMLDQYSSVAKAF